MATELPYLKMKSTLAKMNRRRFPIEPESFDETVTLLEAGTESYSKHYKGHIDSENGRALYFASDQMIQALQSLSEENMSNLVVQTDATFRVVPTSMYQLITMHYLENDQSFAFFHALMSNKSSNLYTEVFNVVKELIPNFNPTKCVTDFELAIKKALQSSFPAISVQGCAFHYAQSVYRWIGKNGLIN